MAHNARTTNTFLLLRGADLTNNVALSTLQLRYHLVDILALSYLRSSRAYPSHLPAHLLLVNACRPTMSTPRLAPRCISPFDSTPTVFRLF
jgi:hypothetical protein